MTTDIDLTAARQTLAADLARTTPSFWRPAWAHSLIGRIIVAIVHGCQYRYVTEQHWAYEQLVRDDTSRIESLSRRMVT